MNHSKHREPTSTPTAQNLWSDTSFGWLGSLAHSRRMQPWGGFLSVLHAVHVCRVMRMFTSTGCSVHPPLCPAFPRLRRMESHPLSEAA